MYLFGGEFIFSGSRGSRSLIAGDSNVHRIAGCIADDGNLQCLPVSGARFGHEVNNFTMSLKRKLHTTTYERVYLHLGSNDVLSAEELFYNKVTVMCDEVHGADPTAEIVLCEILPRGPDMRRGAKRNQQDLRKLTGWIRRANNLLWDLCKRVPYLRFLSYSGFSETHLASDGLHLTPEGARICFSQIAEDAEEWISQPVEQPDQQIDDDWPALPCQAKVDDFGEEKEEEMVKKLYVEVAAESQSVPSVPMRTGCDGDSKRVERKEIQKKTMRRPFTNKKHQRRRFLRAAQRWQRKTFVRKHLARTSSLLEKADLVTMETKDGVGVLLKASNIQGSLLKRPCPPVEREQARSNTSIRTEKRRTCIKWQSCPECKVRCSRDDFLLDHFIKRHIHHKDEEEVRTCKEEQKSEERRPSEPDCEAEQTSANKVEEIPSCEGLFSVFPPSVWRSLHQVMVIGILCGEYGLQHVISTLVIHQNVNLSRLRLLLSNDVETNPGPTYGCRWELCQESFDRFPSLQVHVAEHAHKERTCRWRGCFGCTETEINSIVKHSVRHVYQIEENFFTLEDWHGVLTSGKYDENTNLHLCPRHLRSKLKLLLLDEDFQMTADPYSEADHKDFLKRLSISSKTNFKVIKEEFLNKRKMLGEDWSKYTCSENQDIFTTSVALPSSETVANYHSSNISEEVVHHSDFVLTTRPELASEFFSGTILTSSKKRKNTEPCEINSTRTCTYTPWFNNLTKNLEACENAIFLQKAILDILFGKGLLTAQKQSFLQLEQESARLASINKCTSGTFVNTVFRCMFQGTEFFYVRYVESGIYKGLMLQTFIKQLKETYNILDDNILLHNVLTDEDIIEMKNKHHGENSKRTRPDKMFNRSLEKIASEVSNLREFGNCSEIKLESFVVHFLPYKSRVSVDSHGKSYLESMNSTVSDIKSFLLEFRLNQLDGVEVASKDILKEPTTVCKSLFQQSITLNCLSGDTKRWSNLFKRNGRFESNFLETRFIATSLRYRIFQLYIKRDFDGLFVFLKQCFPELTGDPHSIIEIHVPHVMPSSKRRRRSAAVKRLTISRKDLEKQLPPSTTELIEEVDINIYDHFCCSLVEHGKLSIQQFDASGSLVCCMNDYCDTDGSFRQNDFVYTIKEKQENGDYFFCSCSIYKTLIDLKENHLTDEHVLVLDLEGTNCVTCMHCKFLKEKVIPALDEGNEYKTRINQFIQNAKRDIGKNIIELSHNNDTRKYSVVDEDEDRPSFVHFSFNKRLNNYVISCLNGKCVSLRGHKRSISTLLSSSLCKHLTIFKEHSEYWQHLFDSEIQNTFSDIESLDVAEATINLEDNNIDSVLDRDITFDEESGQPFDEESGLWKFKCRSSHCPSQKDSILYKHNVIKRDNWNDVNMVRLSDGCFKGPILVSDIPDNTCDCGAGWLTGADDTTGITVHDKSRMLTVYTSIAPVKCEIHLRLCNNTISPCKLGWDEGKRDALHVVTRDTAAGDEIGYEFVNMVINSGCTFSAFCQFKNDSYITRHTLARFMSPKVFIKWWFSWAANMNIDFRKPCDVCGHEPKRLCCDGTKVGVGFRHAVFEEINASKQDIQVQQTLHRRMDRCFLKNLHGVEKKQMISYRETLNYLARQVTGDLNNKEILSPDELNIKINSVRQILPDEVVLSFDRFLNMPDSEKLAYAYVLKMLCTTASVTSLLPAPFCARLQQVVNNPNTDDQVFNTVINGMRSYAPEIRDLICESMLNNNDILPTDIRLFLQFLINESMSMESNEPEPAIPQPGTYNPAKFGKAYYFNEFGLKLRDVRKFTIDLERKDKRNVDHDDVALDFERCQKLYSKVQTAAPGTSNLFLWFCADHGHCYGFHMTGAEGRKDPSASLYSYLDKPPTDIFYDFACNLQEYCLNRESGYYKNVRFFHDIFHSYAHKCSSAFKSVRLQGFESVNSEICEQFNSFIQCIKKSARQMSQSHFCFYLQFFLHQWNERKRLLTQRKMRIALAGLV